MQLIRENMDSLFKFEFEINYNNISYPYQNFAELLNILKK